MGPARNGRIDGIGKMKGICLIKRNYPAIIFAMSC